MVKHGRNKKRRAGRIGKTKIKHKDHFTRWDPKPKIADATVQKLWDPSKTPRQNLANMGLALEPNGDTRGMSIAVTGKATNAIELFDVPDSDAPSRREKWPLEKEDQEYIVKCMSKCGTNYSKMFRNTKVNTLQHTEEKLQKMGARFLLLNPNQVLVDEIPEKLLEKMQYGDEIAKKLQETEAEDE